MINLPDQIIYTNRDNEVKRYRRIIGTLGSYVYYSTGGDKTEACLYTKLVSWVFYYNAYSQVNFK